jgi:hypothetical protein
MSESNIRGKQMKKKEDLVQDEKIRQTVQDGYIND